MAETSKKDAFRSVQVESLVIMKIAKHCSSAFPSLASGCIVGMDQKNILEVTNCFALPITELPNEGNFHHNELAGAGAAAAAPRAKSNIIYQQEMIRQLREINVDANSVGWYTSATMGNFITMNFIENQATYQVENPQAIALVYDLARSSQGALSLRAFQLTPQFLSVFKQGKFTTESLRSNKLSFKDILVEYPVEIHSSHLATCFMHELGMNSRHPELPSSMPTSVDDIEKNAPPMPLYPYIDGLDLSIDPFLEKTCDLLLESVENYYTDLNNYQYYQRSLTREQQKIATWQSKRKAENLQRAAAKQPLLPDDEWQRLFKLPQEPSKLEGMLNARQVEQYAKQIDKFTATVTSKMFAVRGSLVHE